MILVVRNEHRIGWPWFLLLHVSISASSTTNAFLSPYFSVKSGSRSWRKYPNHPPSQQTQTQTQTLASLLLEKKNGIQMSSGGEGGGDGNFYNDFGDMFEDEDDNEDDDGEEEEDEEDEEDDDDEYANLDVGSFRAQLDNLMGNENESDDSEVDELISFATGGKTSQAQKPVIEWAKALEFQTVKELESVLTAGTVLVANPEKFCSDFDIENASSSSSNKGNVSPALLSKFGLTLPPPADLGPDRRADLLPVLVILEKHGLKGCQAILMNRRTGYLIGDLEQEKPPPASLPSDFENGPKAEPVSDDDDDNDNDDAGSNGTGGDETQRLWAFMIQPLWFGGTAPGDTGGLDMLHPCPMIPNSKPLTDDGLHWGGDPGAAQTIMERGDVSLVMSGEYDEDGDERTRPLSGFDFKFFVQRTRWLPTQLEKEIRDGTWYPVSVSKEVLFKGRDRLGSKRAKPLWTEIMKLMGGKYKDICDQFYGVSS